MKKNLLFSDLFCNSGSAGWRRCWKSAIFRVRNLRAPDREPNNWEPIKRFAIRKYDEQDEDDNAWRQNAISKLNEMWNIREKRSHLSYQCKCCTSWQEFKSVNIQIMFPCTVTKIYCAGHISASNHPRAFFKVKSPAHRLRFHTCQRRALQSHTKTLFPQY